MLGAMKEPTVYFNGQFVPASQGVLPWFDSGFVMGVTVAEQLRTFAGPLFRLDEHLARLQRSLEIVGVEPDPPLSEFPFAATELVKRNFPLLPPGRDLGLCMFVTPGPYLAMAGEAPAGPTVGMHTYPLPFHLWANKYDAGQALASCSVVQPSTRSWPTELKCRSRVHYHLADREAAAAFPGARALLTDEAGHVTETATANILVVAGDRLISPPRERILPGISLGATRELAEEAGWPVEEADLSVADVANAEEVLLTSTPFCLLPATQLNGRAIGSGSPGACYQALLQAWSELVGLDVVVQAKSAG